MPDHTALGNRIVVGVDGSPGSKAALRWAMIQAHLDNATIEAIGTWQDPSTTGYGIGSSLLTVDGDDLAAVTEKVLTDTVAEVSAQLDTPVDIRTRIAEGHPAQILLAAAAVRDCWCSAAVDTVRSPGSCSARSANTASSIRRARSSSSRNNRSRPRKAPAVPRQSSFAAGQKRVKWHSPPEPSSSMYR